MAERDFMPDIEEVLRAMPREDFRLRLRAELVKANKSEEIKVTAKQASYVREGLRSINSYLVVKDGEAMIEFLQKTFEAELKMRVDRPDGTIMHSEVRVGDTVLELAQGDAQYPPKPVALHIYVEDADAVYQRALAAGAESLAAPVNQEYGDREAGIKDASGNYWYIATHQGARYRPEGLGTVTPYLHPKDAGGLIEFLKQAFRAEEVEVHRGPDGTVAHAKVRIGDSILEMGEAHGQWQPLPPHLHLYVANTDETYREALAAGATSETAPHDAPYGDRAAGVVDRWGNTWWLATYLGA
jgi:PhnB protein